MKITSLKSGTLRLSHLLLEEITRIANWYRKGVRKMALEKAFPLAVALSVFVLIYPVLSHAVDADKYDIAGLRLGMTYEQVREALVDHGIPESDIQETRQSYHYSDGIKHDYQTEGFLYRINAGKRIHGNKSQDSFILYFSPPPEGGRVVAVSRHVTNQVDPPTNGQYREAVHDKYGPPTTSHQNTGVSQWMFGDGTMNCLGTQYEKLAVPVDRRGNSALLEKVFHTSGSRIRTDRFRNGRVNELTECATMLQYDIHGYSLGENRPATSVSAVMIDVQAWVRAELAAGEMVEGLRQEAVKKREGSGARPVL